MRRCQGPAFDAERRSAMNELSTLLSSFPVRAVLLLGGDFNAEVGFKGVGDEGCLGDHAHGRRNRSGHQVVEWAKGEALLFLGDFSSRKRIEIRGFILMMAVVTHWIMSCAVLVIYVFWVLLRFCTKMLSGVPALQLGRRTRITALLRSAWLKAGFFVSPRG